MQDGHPRQAGSSEDRQDHSGEAALRAAVGQAGDPRVLLNRVVAQALVLVAAAEGASWSTRPAGGLSPPTSVFDSVSREAFRVCPSAAGKCCDATTAKPTPELTAKRAERWGRCRCCASRFAVRPARLAC
jgi:hypothetical protein